MHDDRRAGRHRRILRGSRRVRLGQLHGADHALRRLWRRAQGLVGPLQKALHHGRRHRQGSARLLFQHQGDSRQQIWNAQPRPVPRRGPEHRARHRHLDPLFRRIFLSAERPDAVLQKRVRQRVRPLHARPDRRTAQVRIPDRAAAGLCQHLRPGHPLQRAARPHGGACRRDERRPIRQVERAARYQRRLRGHQLRDGVRRGRTDDQGSAAQRRAAQSRHGRRPPRRRAGGSHEGRRCKRVRRRIYGLCRHEHGAKHGRHPGAGAVPDGAAAGRAGSRRLGLRLRRDGQHRQILRRMRRKKAGAAGLDLRLRRRQPRQVLHRVRRKKAGRRPALYLPCTAAAPYSPCSYTKL